MKRIIKEKKSKMKNRYKIENYIYIPFQIFFTYLTLI